MAIDLHKHVTARVGALAVVAALGCDGGGRLELGEHVEPSRAVPVSTVLSGSSRSPAGTLEVCGRVGDVCRSAGCWFVLEEVNEGRLFELRVDLSRRATFTVPPNIQGRTAVVAGRLRRQGADVEFEATGLIVER